MKLWYKTWCETKTRLAMAAILLASVCTVILLFQRGPRLQSGGLLMPYPEYVWNSIYKSYVRDLYVVMVMILGGGTLLQESLTGTVGFSLALPASRANMLYTRALVGVIEIIALAIVPALLIPVVSRLAGEVYPLRQSAEFALLWAFSGVLLFSLALFWSSLVANEYAAWAAAFLSFMTYEALANLSVLARVPTLDVLRVMNGSGLPYLDPVQRTIVGALPLGACAVILAAATGMFIATEQILRRRDF